MDVSRPQSPAAETRVSRVMIVERDTGIRKMVLHFVEQEGCQAFEIDGAGAGLEDLDSLQPDVLILEWQQPGMEGVEVVGQFASRMPSMPILVLTSDTSVDASGEALKAGAFEYLTKPVDAGSLRVALRAALKVSLERRQRQDLEDTLGQIARQSAFPEILSCSPAMKPVFRLMERVLDRDLTVLIQGESGTGKELVAQAIHSHGKRGKGPFVVLNCAALPENLVESELFGHEKGAFTGATATRSGHIEMADSGTLFLDEVGEMPLNIQPKFLRCLQDKKVQRVGGTQMKQVDFRLIAATNSDLMQGVLKTEFREDLFYRLAVYPLQLPPLRERPEDILLLLRHFLKLGGRKRVWIEPQAADLLEAYHWPGNVRELQNFVARLSVIMESDRITRDVVAEQLSSIGQQPGGMASSFTFTTESRREATGLTPPPVRTAAYSEPAWQAELAPPMGGEPASMPGGGAGGVRAAPSPGALPSAISSAARPISFPPSSTVTPYTPPPPGSFSTPPSFPVSAPVATEANSVPEIPAPSPEEILPMAEVEKRTIMRALAAFQGNVTETARALGIGRATLYRYIRKHNLAEPTPQEGEEDEEE